jgi:hypothetical protein
MLSCRQSRQAADFRSYFILLCLFHRLFFLPQSRLRIFRHPDPDD